MRKNERIKVKGCFVIKGYLHDAPLNAPTERNFWELLRKGRDEELVEGAEREDE